MSFHKFAISALAILALDSQATQFAPLDFRARVTNLCDEQRGTSESALALALTEVAAKAVVGYAATVLTELGKEKKEPPETALAAGAFYQFDKENKSWKPSAANCIQFWYGRTDDPARKESPDPVFDSDIDEKLKERWTELGLVESPYLYGEIRIESKEVGLIRFVPVRYYARPNKSFSSAFRGAPTYSTAIDLFSGNQTYATYVLSVSQAIEEPIMLTSNSAVGKASGWVSLPAAPSTGDQAGKSGGYFTAKIVFGATLPGSPFAAALGKALTDNESAVAKALVPESPEAKANAAKDKMVAAFDALTVVAQRQQDIAGNKTPEKEEELKIALVKAQYLANVALLAAGLPPRFGP